MASFAMIARGLIEDALRWVVLLFRSTKSLEAENLFLRRQLARYVVRGVKPRRIDAATQASLVLLSKLFDWRSSLVVVQPEQINARSGVHTPRSTLASWGGRTGAQLMPLYEVHRGFVLSSRIVHADETPISMLDPGAGKTKKAYMWAYARGAYEPDPGVVFDYCLGRGGKYPAEFLKGWTGTLVVDAFGGYDAVLALEGRNTALCVAHARRYYDELFKANASPVAAEAIQRIAWLYTIEADARELSREERLQMRQERSKPLWEQLHLWLQLERNRVPDGSAIAKAIDHSLNHWLGLGRFLLNGDVPIDNNYVENRLRPWALGRRKWLFIGSQLAGERAAVVMSLLQSAKLNGHEPWAYLKDILTRLPTQLNSRIEQLLPHRWMPAG